jgi:hypothetical protein
MIYAKVVNGEIVEYNKSLPFSNETTSFGLNTDVATMVANGYLPVVGSEPEYDKATHKSNGVTYSIVGDEVVKNYNIVAKTVEELEAEAKALVPSSITPRQARLKLLEVNLLDNLEAVITTNRAWQIEWEYATEVKRDSPLIDAVASEASLTVEQIDQMFLEASKL